MRCNSQRSKSNGTYREAEPNHFIDSSDGALSVSYPCLMMIPAPPFGYLNAMASASHTA